MAITLHAEDTTARRRCSTTSQGQRTCSGGQVCRERSAKALTAARWAVGPLMSSSACKVLMCSALHWWHQLAFLWGSTLS